MPFLFGVQMVPFPRNLVFQCWSYSRHDSDQTLTCLKYIPPRFPIFLRLFILLYSLPCSQGLLQLLKYTQVLSCSRPFAHVFPSPEMLSHSQSLPPHETGISGHPIKNKIPESSLPYFSLLCVCFFYKIYHLSYYSPCILPFGLSSPLEYKVRDGRDYANHSH